VSTYKGKERYPYRFKTKDEFKRDYGYNWRSANGKSNIAFVDPMDDLFGKEFPYFIDLKCVDKDHRFQYMFDNGNRFWIIMSFMLTPNVRHPNYKSRKIERVL